MRKSNVCTTIFYLSLLDKSANHLHFCAIPSKFYVPFLQWETANYFKDTNNNSIHLMQEKKPFDHVGLPWDGLKCEVVPMVPETIICTSVSLENDAFEQDPDIYIF